MKKSIKTALTLLWICMIILGGCASSPEEKINTIISTAASPLDGVTMKITECSDTNVTVSIVNNTDKDIQCGEDFRLEMQNEKTSEWREPDTVNDGAFNLVANRIQKDRPYEKVINLERVYGKLEPGRYRIVKTVTDFRGTGDYTDYTFTAEFGIN